MSNYQRGGMMGAAGQRVSERTGGKDEHIQPWKITKSRFLLRAATFVLVAVALPVLSGRLIILPLAWVGGLRLCYGRDNEHTERWRSFCFVGILALAVTLLGAGFFDYIWYPVWWRGNLVDALRGWLFSDQPLRLITTMHIFTPDGDGLRLGEWALFTRAVIVGAVFYAWTVTADLDWRWHMEVVQPMAPNVTFNPASPSSITPPPGMEVLHEKEPESEPKTEAQPIPYGYALEELPPRKPGETWFFGAFPSKVLDMIDPDEIVAADTLRGMFEAVLAGAPFSRNEWHNRRDVLSQDAWHALKDWMVAKGHAKLLPNNHHVITRGGVAMMQNVVDAISQRVI